MVRKGGDLFVDGVRGAIWGTAYANSDGTLAGTVQNRYSYAMYGFGILLSIILIGTVIWFLFGHKTFNPTPVTSKESFKNKKVKDRPMFRKST